LIKNESAKYSLAVFSEIVKEAQRIRCCFNSNFPFTNMWTGPQFHRVELLARDLVKDADKASRVLNQFLINVMAVTVRAQYIDRFKGCCMLIDDLTFLTLPRVQSLTDQISFHREDPQIISNLIHMVLAVEELHRLGFVHRRLTPDCFWAIEDGEQPFILCNHDYTTATTNQQANHNILDS
jgi:hypothetical protein